MMCQQHKCACHMCDLWRFEWPCRAYQSIMWSLLLLAWLYT